MAHKSPPDIDAILSNPLSFKVKLAIGEDTYKSLRYSKHVAEFWDVYGFGATAVSVTSSPFVASIIGTQTGLLSVIGIGTFVTPLPYVIVGSASLTGCYVYLRRLCRRHIKNRVDVIPKFINTPLDIIALSLFHLIAPLIMKLAQSDGEISDEENDLIVDYLCKEWGYSDSFVKSRLPRIHAKVGKRKTKRLLTPFDRYIKANPDCNQHKIIEDILKIMVEVAKVDGILTEEEKRFIASVENHFMPRKRFMRQLAEMVKGKTKKP